MARVVLALLGTAAALAPPLALDRRALLLSSLATAADFAQPIVLTDEEMAARVARKQELLRAQSRRGSGGSGLEGSIRSDVNPDAAVSLRSRSVLDNAKEAMRKQEEMKSRDKKQKRDDLCEMLGRGC